MSNDQKEVWVLENDNHYVIGVYSSLENVENVLKNYQLYNDSFPCGFVLKDKNNITKFVTYCLKLNEPKELWNLERSLK